MTEGGVVCLLMAHDHPDKLHTVGIAWGGSEVITVDEDLNVCRPVKWASLSGGRAR